MISIEAVIKPFKLDDLRDSLEELGIGGMTITEVMQAVPERAGKRRFSSSPTLTDLQPKIKVQIAASRNLAERIIEAICIHGSAGRNEDGILYAQPVDAVIRIRTGEFDEDALS
jgi:nitrogen regulatory protein P-II 1